MINLIIGLLIGFAVTYIVLDQQITQQSGLIEKLNEDLVWEKHKVKCYRKFLREERQKNYERFIKPKEGN
jgi:hypothetical protein